MPPTAAHGASTQSEPLCSCVRALHAALSCLALLACHPPAGACCERGARLSRANPAAQPEGRHTALLHPRGALQPGQCGKGGEAWAGMQRTRRQRNCGLPRLCVGLAAVPLPPRRPTTCCGSRPKTAEANRGPQLCCLASGGSVRRCASRAQGVARGRTGLVQAGQARVAPLQL